MSLSEKIQIFPEKEPPETGYVQPGLIETQHADVLRRMGDLRTAQEYAEESLRTADTSHLRGQAHRLATLAHILGERREADEAAAVGQQMLDRTEGMESGRLHDRIIGLAAALSTYETPAVRDFRERARYQIDAAQ